ncbi:MAG: cytidylate kinase-like family protein [Paraprevotella sp.]|nr:cytidylate kinase-like family protein [Paraprevotella sp.]
MKKHIIINVGRQLGSGGRIIGNRIAQDFNIRFYDKELLDLAAQESGFNKKFFERNDEHKGFFKLLLSPFAPIFGNDDPYTDQLSDESLFKFQSDAIRKAAHQESCLFVGRCADYILRDYPDCVNVFITADMDDRVKRLSKLLDITEKEAEKRCIEGDEKRAKYYNYYSAKTWGYAESYDLCINSSALGVESTIDVIEDFIAKKLQL